MKRLFSTGLVLFLGMVLQIGCGGGGSATGTGNSGNGGGGSSNGGGNNNGGGLVGGDGGTLCSLDAYQGNTCVQGQQATGFYHVEKVRNRYMWITPSGFGFFSKAVASVNSHDGGTTYSDALTAKYGNPFQDLFTHQALTRMQGWGFNTIGDYSNLYSDPWSDRAGVGGRNVKLPDTPLFNLTGTASFGFSNLLFKNVWNGLDTSPTGGCSRCFIGYLADIFDPNFPSAVAGALSNVLVNFPTLGTEPYLMLIMTDDGDNIFGLRRADGLHGGWMAAIMAPTQATASISGTTETYTDPTVYTKQAWIDYLESKYGTIGAVNTAWGSSYTSFTAGSGWPKRTTGSSALIDEDGTSPWFTPSDRSSLAGLNANLHADLDAFRVMMAEQYASIVSSQVRQSIPNHLISNPSPLSSNLVTDPSGQSMLQTFAKYYDVIMVSGNCGEAPLVTQIYNLIHKPLMTGMIITAQQDSPEAGVASAFCNAPAQADRGANYVTNLTQFFNVTGSDGVLPVVGTSWWEWTDKNVGGEHGNFGLVTNKDNAYDGVEDRIAPCTDAWGYKCGGEAANYGDFLVPVEGINKAADQALQNYFQTH